MSVKPIFKLYFFMYDEFVNGGIEEELYKSMYEEE